MSGVSNIIKARGEATIKVHSLAYIQQPIQLKWRCCHIWDTDMS